MIATVQRAPAPSTTKYGEILLRKGFDQTPRSLQEYVTQLDISSSAKLLIFALLSYVREYGQEVFPAVKTLASKIGRSVRQIFYLLRELKERGLIAIFERVREDGGRDTNGYSLVPLFEKVAGQEDEQIERELAQVEEESSEPFTTADCIDEAAIALCEEYGEQQPAQPRAERETARRLRQRWEKMSAAGAEWDYFANLVMAASERTDQRKKIPTRSKKSFTRLLPYFFSSLDRLIAQAAAPAPARAAASCAPTTRPQSARTEKPNREARADNAVPTESRQNNISAEGKKPRPRASAAIEQTIDKIGRQFHDENIKSSVQQAANLQAANNLDEQTMLELIQQARMVTQQYQMTKRDSHGQFNRMPYFFSVLRGKIAIRQQKQ